MRCSASWTVRRSICEIAAVLLTGCAAVLSLHVFGLHVYLFLPALLVWSLYFVRLVRQDPLVLEEWGVRLDNLRPALARCLPFFLLGVLGMLCWRVISGWKPLPLSFFIVLAFYPLYGLVQQFFMQAILVRNLRRLSVPPGIIVPVVSVLFGLLHAPDWPLAGLCMVAGAVWTLLFLRTPNIVPLGFSHGWLGALAYYWLLVRDPLGSLFGGS